MSDAITDAYIESEIQDKISKVIIAELDFLVNPVRKNLKEIYDGCRKIREGYVGAFGKFLEAHEWAEEVSDYYKERFKTKDDFHIIPDDIAALLWRLAPSYRISVLAQLITRAQGVTYDKKNPEWEDIQAYTQRVRKNYHLFHALLSFEDRMYIERDSKEITGGGLEKILTKHKLNKNLLPESLD